MHTASQGWTLIEILTTIMVVGGVIAVFLIVMRALDFAMPVWVWHILGVCVAVFLGILAIRFLLSL